jgi:hypothetical protein
MDQRLRSAVDASIGWYDDICALHGVGSILDDGVWSALETPPPLHSDAVAVEPEVTADRVIARLNGRVHCGVKYLDNRIVAGAVARLGSGTVDVSNVYAIPGHQLDWAELSTVINTYFPGRPLVGYERGTPSMRRSTAASRRSVS